jgi:hypothetical protein
MTSTDRYRRLAAELTAKAHNEKSPQTKAEWKHLAQSYLRLAFQAAKNDLTSRAAHGMRRGLSADPM